VASESRISDYRRTLPPALDDAIDRLGEASDSCGAGKLRRAKGGLKLASKVLDRYLRNLRSLRARKRLADNDAVRSNLIDGGEAARTEMKALHAALQCAGA
jgi:hypothetical protein